MSSSDESSGSIAEEHSVESTVSSESSSVSSEGGEDIGGEEASYWDSEGKLVIKTKKRGKGDKKKPKVKKSAFELAPAQGYSSQYYTPPPVYTSSAPPPAPAASAYTSSAPAAPTYSYPAPTPTPAASAYSSPASAPTYSYPAPAPAAPVYTSNIPSFGNAPPPAAVSTYSYPAPPPAAVSIYSAPPPPAAPVSFSNAPPAAPPVYSYPVPPSPVSTPSFISVVTPPMNMMTMPVKQVAPLVDITERPGEISDDVELLRAAAKIAAEKYPNEARPDVLARCAIQKLRYGYAAITPEREMQIAQILLALSGQQQRQ